jgi:hypothetical protein
MQADDFKTALTKPLHEGFRRILVLMSWIVFIGLSIAIVAAAVGVFQEMGLDEPSILDGTEVTNKDGTKFRFQREWSLSKIPTNVFVLVPLGSITALCVAYGISFRALPSLTGYLWAVIWWVVMGFKNKKE